MGYSWQAVSEANLVRDSDIKGYESLVKGIAKDLEAKGMPYEAARVRASLVNGNYQQNLPFWQEVNSQSQSNISLVKLLCQSFNLRLKNLIENQEINR